MKRLALTVALALSFIAAAGARADDLKLNPYGKVLTNSEGVTVELATLDAKNKDGLYDALIRVTGAAAHDAGIDGKVILHTAEHAGTGFDLVDPAGKHRMSSRQGWGSWDNIEVHLGGKSYYVGYDDKKSKELKVATLLKDYKKK